MKILLFTPRFFGYDKSIEKALLLEKQEVLRITYDENWHLLKNKVLAKSFPTVFLKNQERKWNRYLIEYSKSFAPDLLFIIKGELVYEETLKTIRNKLPHIKICLWQNDNLDEVRMDNLSTALNEIDYFFTYDKSDLRKASNLGFREVNYLPTGYDPSIFRPIEGSYPNLNCDISFVGRAYPKRVKYISNILEKNIRIYGPGYPDRIPIYEKYINLDIVNSLYNNSKIGLSIHEDPIWQGINNRTFEICGSGSLCLVDDWNDIPELFEVDKEIIVFDTVDNMTEKIDIYLNDHSKRIAIAKAGHARAKANHTFQHRMNSLLKLIE